MSRSSSPTTPDLRELRILTYMRGSNGKRVEQYLTPNSTKFDCVASAASFALDLLESEPGRQALRYYTLLVGEEKRIPGLRDMSSGYHEPYVRNFLAEIRASFPHILVTNENGMRYLNGRTNKFNCVNVFVPKRAALIELSDSLVSAMENACRDTRASKSSTDLARFQTFLCRIGITLAHELVHIYTLFLLRLKDSHTPPHASAGGCGSDKAGEAGRYWEDLMFGGFVDMRLVDKTTAAIGLRDGHGKYAWKFRGELIEHLLWRKFTWITVPLTDPDHDYYEKATTRMPTLRWKNNYGDFFPKKAQATTTELPELPPAQLQELMGPRVFAFPKYRVNGAHLRRFCFNPRKDSVEAVPC